jgi:hypothetical protein
LPFGLTPSGAREIASRYCLMIALVPVTLCVTLRVSPLQKIAPGPETNALRAAVARTCNLPEPVTGSVAPEPEGSGEIAVDVAAFP